MKAVFLVFMFLVVMSAEAITPEELQTQIEALLKQLKELQEQLAMAEEESAIVYLEVNPENKEQLEVQLNILNYHYSLAGYQIVIYASGLIPLEVKEGDYFKGKRTIFSFHTEPPDAKRGEIKITSGILGTSEGSSGKGKGNLVKFFFPKTHATFSILEAQLVTLEGLETKIPVVFGPDLMVGEGEQPVITAVSQRGKMATTWGAIKKK